MSYNVPSRAPGDGRTVEEGPGHVPSDSLAAESLRNEGSFAANESRGAYPSAVSGSSTTANTTDTSGATTLPPTSDAPGRFTDSELQGEYRAPHEGSSRKEATGDYYSSVGAQRPDGGQLGPGDATYDTSRGGGDQSSYGGSGGSSYAGAGQSSYGGTAPTSMTPGVHMSSEHSRPKGTNITEGGFDPSEHPNASLAEGGTGDIGGEYDPARSAESRLEHSNARAGFDAGYPGAGQQSGARGTTDQGGFGRLGEDSA